MFGQQDEAVDRSTEHPHLETATASRWRISVVVVVTSVILGAIAGSVWSSLAPGEQFVVVEPGRGAALTGESLHRFDALAIAICAAAIMGVVLPVGFWAWTAARGPILSLVLLIGGIAGSLAMVGSGVGVASLLHPRPDDPAVGSVVTVAPGIESPLILLVQPLLTSLVVLLLAAMNPHDDLRQTVDDDQPTVGAV